MHASAMHVAILILLPGCETLKLCEKGALAACIEREQARLLCKGAI